jgi:flavin-binding protein dodecin
MGIVPNHTYKLVELVGSSTEGVDQAIQNGIARAGKTLKHLDWFEVVAIRGQIADGGIHYYQVAMKVGFRVEDPADLAAD